MANPLFGTRSDESPALVWLKDLDGRYLQVNRRHAEFLSTTEERLLGHTDAEMPPPEVVDGPRLLEGGTRASEPLQFEYPVGAFEGRPPLAALRFAIRDRAGKPIALCGLASPLSDAATARAECARLMQIERWSRLDPVLIRAGILEEWGLEPVFEPPVLVSAEADEDLSSEDEPEIVESEEAIAERERLSADVELAVAERDAVACQAEQADVALAEARAELERVHAALVRERERAERAEIAAREEDERLLEARTELGRAEQALAQARERRETADAELERQREAAERAREEADAHRGLAEQAREKLERERAAAASLGESLASEERLRAEQAQIGLQEVTDQLKRADAALVQERERWELAEAESNRRSRTSAPTCGGGRGRGLRAEGAARR